MARQAERSASTIRRLLDAARTLFARDGYEQVSVDQVVAEASVTKGAFYHHFPSKQALFEQVLDEAQARISQAMSQGGPPPGPPTVRSLAQGAVGYLRLANDPAVRRLVLVDGPTVLGWARWREIDDRHFASRVRDALTFILGPAAEPALVEAATKVTLGAIMEAALASGAANDPAAAVDHYARTLEGLLEGIAGMTRSPGK